MMFHVDLGAGGRDLSIPMLKTWEDVHGLLVEARGEKVVVRLARPVPF